MTREDIYLVQKEPGRGRNIVESSKKANMHVLAEFNLQVHFAIVMGGFLYRFFQEMHVMIMYIVV